MIIPEINADHAALIERAKKTTRLDDRPYRRQTKLFSAVLRAGAPTTP